ncbi:hypothetical protein [Vibrio cholerae]|uniref:hypothetical protein n=1 Tax=Vibrio cholerae TaxID=666 RepID=UPI00115919FB|nr:hypothetical protein [Vibrio cholerae]MDV2313029.1 hypothetical protein [Vibrio cholerae]MDV2335508.1 hypothetical protein [Vibrio cholerae]TQQ33911.1 hypothetical protein FLL70_16245 [Vibrio cholerae]
MTDKLDILARLDAMSDDEFFNELAKADDFGLTDLLGTPLDYLSRHKKTSIYHEDFSYLLQFIISAPAQRKSATKRYNSSSSYKEASSVGGRFSFGTKCLESELMCA